MVEMPRESGRKVRGVPRNPPACTLLRPGARLGDGASRAGAGTKCTALALGSAASLIPPARGCSVLPCPAPLPRAHARRFPHRLHSKLPSR